MQPNEQYDYARYESDELWQHEIKFTLCLIPSRCSLWVFWCAGFHVGVGGWGGRRAGDPRRERRSAAGTCALWLIALMDVSASGPPKPLAGDNGPGGGRAAVI